jgi:hypothetical protein
MSLIKKNLNILIMAGGALLVLGLVYIATEKTRVSKTAPVQIVPQENNRFDITLPGTSAPGTQSTGAPTPAPAQSTPSGGKAPAVGGPTLGAPKTN